MTGRHFREPLHLPSVYPLGAVKKLKGLIS